MGLLVSVQREDVPELLKKLPGEEVVRLVVNLIDRHHRLMGSDLALAELARLHGPEAAPEVQRGIRAALRTLRMDLTGEECAL